MIYPSWIFNTLSQEINGCDKPAVKVEKEEDFVSLFFTDAVNFSFNIRNRTPWVMRVISPESWFVYIIYCSDSSLYTGITKDIYRRIYQHNSGKGAKYTRNRHPVYLVYCETLSNRSEASKKEYQLKQLTRKEKIQLVLDNKGDTFNFYDTYLHPRQRLEQSDR